MSSSRSHWDELEQLAYESLAPSIPTVLIDTLSAKEADNFLSGLHPTGAPLLLQDGKVQFYGCRWCRHRRKQIDTKCHEVGIHLARKRLGGEPGQGEWSSLHVRDEWPACERHEQ